MRTQVGVYKTLEKIGEGGMGEVYRGLDTMLEREVAIKQLRAEFAGRSDIVERFRTEAVTLGKLNHPNVVTLYSFLREDNALYMVLEFVRGETLDAMIRRRGALPWTEAVGLVIQALRGLEHAHVMQVIHRDVKPANVILTPAGVLKLMDFGIARILNTARMTRVGHMIGTLEYMAPEQVRGGDGDARADLYSLAIVLYELLTGHTPFKGATDYELIKAQVEASAPPLSAFGVVVPPALAKVLARALEKAPEKRFQSAAAFAQALQMVLDEMGATVSPNRQTSSIGPGVGPRPASLVRRIREAMHSLMQRVRPPLHATLARVKANPMLAAAALMVLIGLGLALVAISDRGAPGKSSAGAGGKADGSGVAVPGGAPRPSMPIPNTPQHKTLPPPGGEESPRAPGSKPDVGPPSKSKSPIPKERVAPSEKPAPLVPEKSAPPSSPAPSPTPSPAPSPPPSPAPSPPPSPTPPPRETPGQGPWKFRQ